MKEKLHTIPVNEAFDEGGECPLCNMVKSLETRAIEFTLGPSYMEDDVRGDTSRLGFCEKHLELLYKNQNRLGLSLIIKSHMDRIIEYIEKQTGSGIRISAPAFLRKKGEASGVVSYLEKLQSSCYVCEKIDGTFERYIATIFHLYHQEETFRNKYRSAKGFCTRHYKTLYEAAPKYFSGSELNDFIKELHSVYLENMKRVRDDLEWLINKFDYRYANEPWKNSKDALPRAIQKTNSIL